MSTRPPTFDRSETRAVALLFALAGVAALVTAGHRWLTGPEHAVEMGLLLFAGPVLLVSSLWVANNPGALLTTVRATAALGAAYLVARAGWAASFAPDLVDLRRHLTHAAAWAPVVYMLLHFGLPGRRARTASLSLWALLVGITLIALVGPFRQQMHPLERFALAEWSLLAQGMFIVALGLYTRSRERAVQAIQLHTQARTDALTGVMNRRGLERRWSCTATGPCRPPAACPW